MADIYTRAGRSALMARIRSTGNASTEAALARVLRAAGLSGWRRQQAVRGRDRAGEVFRVRPDFIFRARRVAVFVDGCFWHGCPEHGGRPKGNAAFWRAKFARNRERDRRDTRRLRAAGWTVLRLWEHELRAGRRAALLRKLGRVLAVDSSKQEARPRGRASRASGRTAQSAR
jgi:DNA mismatch endonuclease (patch repair protein)